MQARRPDLAFISFGTTHLPPSAELRSVLSQAIASSTRSLSLYVESCPLVKLLVGGKEGVARPPTTLPLPGNNSGTLDLRTAVPWHVFSRRAKVSPTATAVQLHASCRLVSW